MMEKNIRGLSVAVAGTGLRPGSAASAIEGIGRTRGNQNGAAKETGSTTSARAAGSFDKNHPGYIAGFNAGNARGIAVQRYVAANGQAEMATRLLANHDLTAGEIVGILAEVAGDQDPAAAARAAAEEVRAAIAEANPQAHAEGAPAQSSTQAMWERAIAANAKGMPL